VSVKGLIVIEIKIYSDLWRVIELARTSEQVFASSTYS